MTKIEELMNEQLDVLVAEKVMEWSRGPSGVCWFTKDNKAVKDWWQVCAYVRTEYWWRPSTDLACAFQVDKPEWEWVFVECGDELDIYVEDRKRHYLLTRIRIPLDPANKTAAYCRGRCIAALKACGIKEV